MADIRIFVVLYIDTSAVCIIVFFSVELLDENNNVSLSISFNAKIITNVFVEGIRRFHLLWHLDVSSVPLSL